MSDFRTDVIALLPHLRAFARNLTRGDAQAADDIVQDTVVNALQAEDRFEPGTNLKSWLFTILRNRFYNVIKRKHVTSEVADEDLERRFAVPAHQEARVEFEAFRRVFGDLSANHREVLILVAVHGLPYEEIAEICGCEVGTVKSRVNRARNILKRGMLGDEAEPVERAAHNERPARSRGNTADTAATAQLA